jgi:hypothetical protein
VSFLFQKLLKNICEAVFVAQSIDRLGYVMGDMGFNSQHAEDFSLFSRPALVHTKPASHEYTVGRSCFSAGSKARALQLNTHLRVIFLLPLYAFIACIETFVYSRYLVDILEGI